jgi:hypothetical protein
VYNPTEEGLGVPFEMSLAIHSDAGVSKQDEQIGTLGIYTTDFNDGKLNAGTSRMASRDLADLMLTQIKSDVQATFGQAWTRRGLWDRNYSETRLPGVPSAIVEMLSHQNFADMRYGHDPVFKFTVGRAIYKATLKFISEQHGRDYVVQPLPVSHFAISRRADDEFLLTWKAENDPTEPTAKPKEYIVYTAEGNNAFDNGVRVKDCHHTAKLKPGEVYSFRVSAVNAGGESFPSETLTAYKAPNEKACVLIVNGFHRLSGPAQVNTATTAAFDIEQDPGVAYMSNQSYCGAQLVTDRAQAGRDGETGLGYSGSELEGLKIAGNTLDYPYTHGRAIAAAGGYSFTSCCNEAIEDGTISLTDYKLVDYICGLEKDSPANMRFSKSFTQQMQQALTAYCATGGGLMVSGAYIGSDMTATDAQREWTAGTLRYSCTGRLTDKNISEVDGMGMKLSVPRTVNERVYAVTTADCLLPVGDAFTAMVYGNGESAATAYDGNYRVFAMGFPFECIEQESGRNTLMAAVLRFLQKH